MNYDSYIICTANRFHDTDLKIAKKIAGSGKDFYFVRTKFDQDIFNTENDSGRYLNEKDIEKLSDYLKHDILDRLSKEGLKPKNVFVLSALMSQAKMIDNRRKYDFVKLQDELIAYFSQKVKPNISNHLPKFAIELVKMTNKEITDTIFQESIYW